MGAFHLVLNVAGFAFAVTFAAWLVYRLVMFLGEGRR